jgi:transcription elongation factor Elf1
MPEFQTPSFSCPLCGAIAYEPTIVTRADGTSGDGWYRCTKCRRYSVSLRSAKQHIPTYTKPHR